MNVPRSMRWFPTIAAALGLGVTAAPARAMALYQPQDTRRDVYEVEDARWRDAADSTAALFQAKRVSIQGDRAFLETRSYGEAFRLCRTEPFRDQPSGADCSGSLVAPDLVLTAGHCVVNKASCAATRVVFGFSLAAEGGEAASVPASEVYRCAEIAAHRTDYAESDDWALLRLDRPVKNHRPLRVDPGAAPPGTPLAVIGHPGGLPTKVSVAGFVREDASPNAFKADLDTFVHSSGSPVFDARSGLIVGILTSGAADFKWSGACYKTVRCTMDACEGETVTKAAVFSAAVNESSAAKPAESPARIPPPAARFDAGDSRALDQLEAAPAAAAFQSR